MSAIKLLQIYINLQIYIHAPGQCLMKHQSQYINKSARQISLMEEMVSNDRLFFFKTVFPLISSSNIFQ